MVIIKKFDIYLKSIIVIALIIVTVIIIIIIQLKWNTTV